MYRNKFFLKKDNVIGKDRKDWVFYGCQVSSTVPNYPGSSGILLLNTGDYL